jgi:hypothetical protein
MALILSTRLFAEPVPSSTGILRGMGQAPIGPTAAEAQHRKQILQGKPSDEHWMRNGQIGMRFHF